MLDLLITLKEIQKSQFRYARQDEKMKKPRLFALDSYIHALKDIHSN